MMKFLLSSALLTCILFFFYLCNIYRVFTVFSTSKDHRQGQAAMAGCILVDFDKIQVRAPL